DLQDLRFVELLEYVAEAEHDDLVTDDEHTLSGIVQVDGVEHRPEPEDNISPALAPRRPVIKLAESPTVCRFFREAMADTRRCKAIEDSKLAFAQPFIDDGSCRATDQCSLAADDLRTLLGSHIWRGQDDFWS